MIPAPDRRPEGLRVWDIAPGISLWCEGGHLSRNGDAYRPSAWGVSVKKDSTARVPAPNEITRAQARAILEHLAEQSERKQELLRTIRHLSMDAITQAEADEMRGQIATMVAEIGTLRGSLRAARESHRDNLIGIGNSLAGLEMPSATRDSLAETIANSVACVYALAANDGEVTK